VAGEPPSSAARANQVSSRERDFFIHVAEGSLDNPRHYARVRGRVVATGRHVRVYLDTRLNAASLAPGLVEDIISRFDNEIIPLAERALGRYRDVDGDGRFSVLLTAWLGRLEGGRTSLGGFVRGADFRLDIDPPFSNRCDMLYLNADLQPGPHLGALLAHEYAHAVCVSERAPVIGAGSAPSEDDWLNEAIAHLAENLYDVSWSNLDYRISRYLSDPAAYPLVVPDYYEAGLWRNHGCRGATFLMLRWCVDQFGEDLLRQLVRGPAAGVRNLEAATGRRFDELYRRWTVAVGMASGDAAGGYRSVRLHGVLCGWGLAGPRRELWDAAGDGRLLILKGTTTSFVEVRASRAGARSLRLTATPGARLQVTLIPLPAEAPQLNLDAEWCAATGGMRSDRAPATLRLIPSANTRDMQIEWVACEQHDGEARKTVRWSADKLPIRTLATGSRRRELGTLRSAESSFELTLPPGLEPDVPLIVKIAARDAHGRRTAAWVDVPPTSSADQPIRLTAHAGDPATARKNPQNR
jgi:hypothetical protein